MTFGIPENPMVNAVIPPERILDAEAIASSLSVKIEQLYATDWRDQEQRTEAVRIAIRDAIEAGK